MQIITHIVPRNFGKLADLSAKYPGMVAKVDVKHCKVLMLPRVAANSEMPRAA